MAVITREALSAVNMFVQLPCLGMSKVGVGVTGTFVGTLSFQGSFDGTNFVPLSVTPFASGTAVSTTTATGNWEVAVQNYMVIRVKFTARTSGTAIVTMAGSADASYQDAFLADTTVYVSQSSTQNAVNTLTQAAQTNRAWRLASLIISITGQPAWLTSPNLQITDGAGGAVLYAVDIPLSGSSGQVFQVPLPVGDNITTPGAARGVVNTPGNAMVVVIAAAGGVNITRANAEFHAA